MMIGRVDSNLARFGGLVLLSEHPQAYPLIQARWLLPACLPESVRRDSVRRDSGS